MPDSYIQHAQSPIRRKSVQLKQHSQCDQRMTETGYSLSSLQQTTKRGLNQEHYGKFPNLPRENEESTGSATRSS